MSTTTPNMGLIKPGVNETYDVDIFNANMDAIDSGVTEINSVINETDFKTYYVNSATGDDVNGQGTTALPFKTIARAANEAPLLNTQIYLQDAGDPYIINSYISISNRTVGLSGESDTGAVINHISGGFQVFNGVISAQRVAINTAGNFVMTNSGSVSVHMGGSWGVVVTLTSASAGAFIYTNNSRAPLQGSSYMPAAVLHIALSKVTLNSGTGAAFSLWSWNTSYERAFATLTMYSVTKNENCYWVSGSDSITEIANSTYMLAGETFYKYARPLRKLDYSGSSYTDFVILLQQVGISGYRWINGEFTFTRARSGGTTGLGVHKVYTITGYSTTTITARLDKQGAYNSRYVVVEYEGLKYLALDIYNISGNPYDIWFAGETSALIRAPETGGGTEANQFKIINYYKNNTSTIIDEGIYNSKKSLAESGFTIPDVYKYFGNTVAPIQDNTYDLGRSSYRFKDIYAANPVISTSDGRMKENIAPLGDKAIEFLMRLNPVGFTYKDYGMRTHYGLIAQEVLKSMYESGMGTLDFAGFIASPVYSEVQATDESGEPLFEETIGMGENGEEVTVKIPVMKSVIVGSVNGLRYEEFIPPLIKTVQEQQKRIILLEDKFNNK